MSVALTGTSLQLRDVVEVARDGAPVTIDTDALARMAEARTVVERALARGDLVYGLTTGVGAGKDRTLTPEDAAASQWRLVRSHLVGQGPRFPHEVVRAAALVLANGFVAGWAGVRAALATRLVDAVNEDRLPAVRSLGSVGQADLAPLAELAVGVFDGTDLEPGEGLALLSSDAFAIGHAALGLDEAAHVLDALEVAGAMSLEGFGANLDLLDDAVAAGRGATELRTSLERLRAALDGSELWRPGSARNLQDPLSFRSLPQVLGTARDAHTFAATQVGDLLNAPQGNPVVATDRLVSGAWFDAQPLATALDVVRIGLAPAVLASGERTVKLLDASWSGLPRGLVPDTPDGLAFLGITAQALAAEAALLAAPVSFALASTAHAEGIEDRTALAPLAARRLDAIVDLAARVVAIELLVAAQAIAVRGRPAAAGLTTALEAIRAQALLVTAARSDPPDLEPLAASVRAGVVRAVS